MNLEDYKKIHLPETPGVYFFRDEKGAVLYIGKATSLKDRVRSYFAKDLHKTRGLKIVSMVLNASTVTHEVTHSVLEAILKEVELIKKYKPVFNTKEKDDKSYNSIIITKEKFPRVLTVRSRNVLEEMKKDILYTFGPFSSSQALKDTLKIIRKVFPFRDKCELNVGKPCFNAQIGLCPGVCNGQISETEYKKTIANLVKFFKGKREDLIKDLKRQMNDEAKKMNFEKAQEIKKTLFSLTHIKDSSLIKYTKSTEKDTSSLRMEGYDVAHISGTNRVGVMVVIENGEANKNEYRKFKLPENINDDYAALREILTRRFKHEEWTVPDLIVIDGGAGQFNVAKEVLSTYSLKIPIVCVVKNDKHTFSHALGDMELFAKNKNEILLTNSESHRFAVSYHTKLRNKNLFNIKDKKVKKKRNINI